MGAQSSKGGVAAEENASADPAAAKANGQENGHVKTNGDVAAKPDGETAAADGNGAAEPAKEGDGGAADAIEPAPAADGEAVKAEGENKDSKKKFSLKNSFKFKGISLKKCKKGSKEGKEEATAEDKPEENGHTAKETNDETQAEGEAASPADAAPEDGAKTEAEAAAPTESSPAEDTTPEAPEKEAKAE